MLGAMLGSGYRDFHGEVPDTEELSLVGEIDSNYPQIKCIEYQYCATLLSVFIPSRS